jgi:spore coat protein U-like protein
MRTISAFGRTPGFCLLAAAALASTPASAQTVSSTLDVDANVTANCTVSTSQLDFGDVNPIDGNNYDSTGGFTVTCTSGTDWDAAADVGIGAGATFAARRMTSGGNTLVYSIYTNAARTTLWGDGTGTTQIISNTGTGVAQAVTVYGRVPLGQNSVPPGAYDDDVTVTVTY